MPVAQERHAALQQSRGGQPRRGRLFLRSGRRVAPLGKVREGNRRQPLMPQKIDRAIAGDRHHPGHSPSPRCLELCGTLPDADEHILQGLFGQRPAPQNAGQAGEQQRRHELIQALQGARIRGGAAVQQGLQLLLELRV